MRSTNQGLLLVGLVAVACVTAGGCDANSSPTDASTDTSTDTSTPPTYTGDVRPILSRACVQCHTPGQIAPFRLDSYEAAESFAPAIAAAVRARTMPPFLADNAGECNTFREANWLSEREIDTITRWAAAGAPQGDPSIPAPPPIEAPTLAGDVRAVTLPVDYTPSTAGADDYRCFVVDSPVSTGTYFVTGFDVVPGNRSIVHHVIVYNPRNDAEAARARALDDAEAGPGYTCFGAAGVGAGAVAAWAPGGGATHFPTGMGVQLAGGRPLVLQVHYNTLAAVGPDRTRVDLEVRASGVLPGRFLPLAALDLSLPPRVNNATAGATLRPSDYTNITTPVRIYGVFPHMHTLGRSLRVDVVHGDGSRTCVVNVPRWDFHWQRLYFHQSPLRLLPTEQLSIACRYDTTARDTVTAWGEGTQDEMCVAGIFVGL